MGYKNREIEIKLQVDGLDLESVNNILLTLVNETKNKSIYGVSTDTYWALKDPDVNGDFIRLRDLDDRREITVKGKDKDNNLDRMEIDIDSTTPSAKIKDLLRAAHGPEVGSIRKKYHVHWWYGYKHETISCYQVSNDKRVFIEVEMTTVSHAEEVAAQIIELFEGYRSTITRLDKSLYELFILKEKSDVIS